MDWNISKDHKFTVRYNDVVGTSDQPTNATADLQIIPVTQAV